MKYSMVLNVQVFFLFILHIYIRYMKVPIISLGVGTLNISSFTHQQEKYIFRVCVCNVSNYDYDHFRSCRWGSSLTVCARLTVRSFNISPNHSKVISEVSEP